MSGDSIQGLFENLGVQLPPGMANNAGLASAFTDTTSAASGLAAAIQSLDDAISAGDSASIVSSGLTLLELIAKLLETLPKIATELGNLTTSHPGLTPAEVNFINTLVDALPLRLTEYLLVEWLNMSAPLVPLIAGLIGIRDFIPVTTDNTNSVAAPYVPTSIRFDRLGLLFKDPATYLVDTFEFGAASFDGLDIMQRIQTWFNRPSKLAEFNDDPNGATLGLPWLQLAVDKSVSPPGLVSTISMPPSWQFSLNEPLGGPFSMTLTANGNFPYSTQILLSPKGYLALVPPAGAAPTLELSFSIAAPAAGGQPVILIGQTGSSRLQADQISIGAGLTASWDTATESATVDPSIQMAITGGQLIIDMSEADGFLSSVTSGTPIQAAFAFSLSWSPATGIHITGGAQLEIDLPLHIDLGPVTIDEVYIVAGAAADGMTLELSGALGVTLGPIEASVDRVGLLGTLAFPSQGGNLGPADLKLGFKPPDGLGLEIDAGPASGGGYITFDPSQGQYAGALDVSLMDVVQVKVIGVIDTIMPDGSSGFSFVLIITFDLPPIELGFGFTLNGVGGLGGVNRTIDTTALQAGFVAHSLNSILFPPDPIANAPAIISNIRSFFPVAQDSYIFGPMVEIGWGTPTLITLEIGVILELPNPVVIVLLGLVDVALPDADAALIQIHIDVLGELDFGTKTLEIEGDMYDSSVLIYSMAGSLFFRICWGDDPNFIYSVGGFNPNFNTAGLDVPTLQRCSVSIGYGDNPRISANNYFAVTSNSLQFGANVQAYASAAGFAIQGYLGFDVLIIFSPFSFEFDFTVSFSVSFEGINLLGLSVSGSFSGPRPWNLNGTASISILFWTVSASVNLTWGDSTPVTLPQKPVLPDLVKAFEATGNWSAALPAGMTPAVSLTATTPSEPTLLVYPMGTLSVRENVVPLDFQITRYGNATPSDGDIFAISDVTINGLQTTRQTFKEFFAPGQFSDLSDADKLSLPSFEPYDAGVTIGSNAIDSGQDSPRSVVYEESYIDSPMSYSRATGPYLMAANLNDALMRQGAGFVAPVANTGLGKFAAVPTAAQTAAIHTAEQAFVVANTNDLTVRADISSASGATYFQARAALGAHLSANPADADNLQVVTLYEVAA